MSHRTPFNRNCPAVLTSAILAILLSVLPILAAGPQNTSDKTDQNAKANARVNPLTLAMEFSLPLMAYPGRGGNGKSIALSYSSKVWTAEFFNYWHRVTAPTNPNYPYNVTNATDVYGEFGKYSLGGWTSGLTPPTIVEEIESYTQNGDNFLIASLPPAGVTNNHACPIIDYMTQPTSFSQCPSGQGNFSVHQCEDGLTYHHFLDCVGDGGGFPGGGGTGLGGGPPDPAPVPTPTPLIRHVVQRVRVIMPGGQNIEFRKDDRVFDCSVFGPECLAGREGTYYSVDGSRLRLELAALQPNNTQQDVLYLPDGGRFIFNAGQRYRIADKYIDAQGNTETYNAVQKTWRDTMGRSVPNLLPPTFEGGLPSTGTQQVYLDGLDGGAAQNYALEWRKLKANCTTGTEPECQQSSAETSALENPADTLAHIGQDSCLNENDSPVGPSLFESDDPVIETRPTTNGTGSVIFTEKYRFCDSTLRTAAGVFNPLLLAGVTLPNGTKYQFRYNKYGEITKITYPAGGYERFIYGPVPSVSDGGGGSGSLYTQTNRGVLERWVSFADGAPPQHWQYAVAGSPNTPHLIFTTVAPDDTLTQNFYRAIGGSEFGFSSPLDGSLEETRVYSRPDAANNNERTLRRRTLAETTVTPPTGPPNPRAARDPRPGRSISLTFESGATSALAQLSTPEYDTHTDQGYFAQLNVKRAKTYHYAGIPLTEAQNYDLETLAGYFSNSNPAAVTETDYLYSENYKARNINGLATETRLFKGAETTPVSKTQMFYDQPGYSSPGNCELSGLAAGTFEPPTPAIPEGPVFYGRATTTKTFSEANNNPTTAIVAHAWYDIYGNVVKVSDALGRESSTSFNTQFGCAYPVSATGPAPDPAGPAGSGNNGGTYGSKTGFTTTTNYDYNTGLVLSVTDANGLITTTDYDQYLRPERVNPPAGGAISETEYHVLPPGQPWSLGTVWVEKRSRVDSDPNHWAKAREYFDGLGRSVRSYSFNGDYFTVKNAAGGTTNCDWFGSETHYDSMGRVKEVSQQFCAETPGGGAPGNVWTVSTYDDLGRVTKVTTPDNAEVNTSFGLLTSGSLLGSTVTVTDQAGKMRRSLTDGLGRLVRVDEPANPTTQEPNGTLGPVETPAQATYYTYDIQGNLRKVTQGAQERFFAYDSLGRLLRAKNPEQADNPALSYPDPITQHNGWSMGYEYDAGGNLKNRIDARNILTKYDYDNLNRNTRTRYFLNGNENTPDPQTPEVRRYYDGWRNNAPEVTGVVLGQLWQTETVNTSLVKLGAFDSLGRAKAVTQSFWNPASGTFAWSYTTQQTYRPIGGQVESMTYPSGHTTNYEFDISGRLVKFKGKLGEGVDRTYAELPVFDWRGQLQSEKYRTLTPLYHKMQYNVRGQMWDMQLGTTAEVTGAEAFNRGRIQNIYTSDAAAGAATPVNLTESQTTGDNNNGNLQRQNILLPDGSYWQQSYQYDELNRLQSAGEKRYLPVPNAPGTYSPSDTFVQAFNYDRHGNRLTDAAPTWGVPEPAFIRDTPPGQNETNNNRLCAPADANLPEPNRLMQYDAAGNLYKDYYAPAINPGTGGERLFDAENRMTEAWAGVPGQSILQGKYRYDGDGRRISRITATSETWQIYGFGGELLAEYNAQNAAFIPTKEYGYQGGKLLITASNGDEQRLRRWVENLYMHTYGYLPAESEIQAKVNALATGGSNADPNVFVQTAQGQAESLFSSPTYAARDRNNYDYVRDLYAVYLQRPADPGGLEWWAGQAANPANRYAIRQDFANPLIEVGDGEFADSEFATRLKDLRGNEASDTARTDQFINYIYFAALNAHLLDENIRIGYQDDFNLASAKGQADVVAQAKQFVKDRFNSPAYISRNRTQQEFIYDLYIAYLRHEPDQAGWEWWTPRVGEQWQNKQAIINDFANTAAFETQAKTLYREVLWLIGDHLGTPRLIAERTGKAEGIKRRDFLPFGEELMAGGRDVANGYTLASARQKFTAYERDDETGLDYAQARYYGPAMGRFISVDPLMASGKAEDPQTWNRYAYVLNQPLTLTDSSGMSPDGEDDDVIRISVWSFREFRDQVVYYLTGTLPSRPGVDYTFKENWTNNGVGFKAVPINNSPGDPMLGAAVKTAKDALEAAGNIPIYGQILKSQAAGTSADLGTGSKANAILQGALVGVEFATTFTPSGGVKSAVTETAGNSVRASVTGIVNRGGRFADLDYAKRAGEVGHHMPQNAFNRIIGLARAEGPALGMTIEDHGETRTYGGRGKRSMRLDFGLTPRQRMYLDIRDVRSLFGNRYNRGMLEMVDYSKTLPAFMK